MSKVAKNTMWLFLSSLIGHTFSLILIIIIARSLGEEGLGIYSFAFSFTTIFVFIFDFGVLNLMVREVARDRTKKHKYIGNIITLKFFLSLVAYIVPAIVILFLDKPLIIKQATLVAGVAMFFHYFGYTYRSIFQAFEKMEYEAISRIIERLVALGIGITVLSRGYGVLSLCWVLVFSYSIYFVLLFLFSIKKYGWIQPQFDPHFCWKLIKKSMPFWFTMLFTAIYFKIDLSMITLLVKDNPAAATGLYNAAYTIIDGLFFIPVIATTALYPAMSRLFNESQTKLMGLYKKAAYYLCVLAFPIGVGTTFLARRIIISLYGENFVLSFLVLQILIWAEAILFLAYLMGYLLNSIDKQKLFTWAAGICALANIILNYFLIQTYSYVGAAVATFITEILSFAILFWFTSRHGYGLNLFKLTWRPIVSAVFMGLLIWKIGFLHLFVIVPIAGVVYFIILYSLKGIDKKDIAYVLKKIFN